jgi:hypothetical protein
LGLPVIKAFYERLIASGKPRMAALGAALRKLRMIIAVGVLRSGKPFAPNWAERGQQARAKAVTAAT